MRVAIIDVGTNTINLLIADKDERELGFTILFVDKIAAKLGAGGIHNKIITPEAFERGIQALEKHLLCISEWQVEQTFAFATASLRIPENGEVFVKAAKDLLNLDIEIISGNREAQLIYDGVRQIVPLDDANALIVDIGGGSVEFIWCNSQGVKWMQSFNIGVSLLLEQFKPEDPITATEVANITDFLDTTLMPLWDAIKEPTNHLIGASGSFNTLANILMPERVGHYVPKKEVLDLSRLTRILQEMMLLNYEARSVIPGMDDARIEYMPLASILIRLIMEKLNINQVTQSPFALKEGAMLELFQS